MFDLFALWLHFTGTIPGVSILFMTDIYESLHRWRITIPNASSDTDATSENTSLDCLIMLYFLWPTMLCPKFDQKKNRWFSLILNSLSSFAVDVVICLYSSSQSNNRLICILVFVCWYKPVIIVSKLQYNNYRNVLINNNTHIICMMPNFFDCIKSIRIYIMFSINKSDYPYYCNWIAISYINLTGQM